MLIRSLLIDNYRVIRSARIMLPEAVIGIIGPNGAGKTSLIEAIAWALYGTGAARSGKDQIAAERASVDDVCRVALTFDIHGVTYRVERCLIGRGRRPEVTVCGADGSLLATGVSDVGAFVTKLFGLDFKGFLTSFLARQQELNAFSDLVPSKRREHLATLLGIDRLDRAIAEMRTDSRVQQAEMAVLQSSLEQRASLTTELETLAGTLVRLEKDRQEAAGARDTARQTLDRRTSEFKAEQERKDRCSGLEGRLQGARTGLKHVQERLLRLEHEAAALQLQTARAATLKAALADFPALRQRRDALLDRQKGAALADELDRQLAGLIARREHTDRTLAELDRRLTELIERAAAMPNRSESDLTAIESRLETARAQYTETTARLRAVETDRARLTERLADMQSVGEAAACDRCGRPFGDDLPSIRDHFRTELESCRLDIERLTTEQQSVRQTGETLSDELRQARAEQQVRRELDREIKTGTDRRTELRAQQAELTEQERLATDKRSGLGSLHFNPAELEEVQAALGRLEQLEIEHNQALGRLQRQPIVAEEIRQTHDAIAQATAEITGLETELAAIGFDLSVFQTAATALQAAQSAFETASGRAADCEREFQLASREQDIKQKQLAELAVTERTLEQMREAAFYSEKLQSLFKQFRSSVIANIRPSLAAISSRLMADMTDGRYTLLDLDEQYNLLVMDNGRYFPVERFSGGEKDLANLCLRLAISQALTDAAGIDSAFVILDEIFGSQDDGRRELIFDGLAGLKRRFAQIVLVTHIEDIKNRVECLIEVRPGADGWSEVIVHE